MPRHHAFLGVLFAMASTCTWGAEDHYALSYSTYFGGSKWEYARDVCADAHGNAYIVGAAASSDFPTTSGAYQRVQDKSGTHVGSYGYCDAFVAKFDPAGSLVWSTFLGGPNYDRAYAVEVDQEGFVYVAGRAGPGFPVTTNSFQPDWKGVDQGSYGWQNAFVAKLTPDGSNLVWASHVGFGEMCRDLAIDAAGDIYLPLDKVALSFVPPGTNYTLPLEWFTNAYQPTPAGGSEIGVIKVKSDGTRVLWATWLGGSGNEGSAASIRVDADGCAHLFGQTASRGFPTTPGAWQTTMNGSDDHFLARFSADGSQLLYSTFIGGSANNDYLISTHNLALDAHTNAYVAGCCGSTDIPTTPGVVQPAHAGGTYDMIVVKLNPTGGLVYSTYLGGSAGGENADGIYVDDAGNVFISGDTGSADFPLTTGACQRVYGGGSYDTFLVRLSADFSHLLYSTLLGGASWDAGRSGFMDQSGNLYLAGSCDGVGWPCTNAYEAAFQGRGTDPGFAYPGWGAGDAVLARFIPPDRGLRFTAIGASPAGVTLALTNLTATIPYTIQRTDRLVPTSIWDRAQSFTSNSPTYIWNDNLGGMNRAFYRAKSGL